MVAIASPTPGNAEKFAKHYGVPRWFTDYRELLREPDIEMVTITAPNRLHCQMTIDIADAGKHVVCEKPLCITLEEADVDDRACAQAGRAADLRRGAVLHAEVRQGEGDGGRGRVRRRVSREAEREALGPHARLVLGRRAVGRRRADGPGLPRHRVLQLVPRATELEERDGAPAAPRSTATRRTATTTARDHRVRGRHDRPRRGLAGRGTGGMDDRIEVFGRKGCTYADLHMGNALPTFSEVGFGYAVEKAPTTRGWTYPVFEELWNYGFPQEMRHFARCVRGKETPIATGEDGRFVQEVLYAAYQSMGAGAARGHALQRVRREETDRSLVQSEALTGSADTICHRDSSWREKPPADRRLVIRQ